LTFTRADAGLHLDANVTSLAIDSAHPSTLYAGTDSGVYRSRDSGASWWAIGQLLAGQLVDSLAISSGSTRDNPGLVPRRIAAGSDGLTRVLWGGEHGEGEVWFLDSAWDHVAVEVPVLP
jgi:hypothetical protein